MEIQYRATQTNFNDDEKKICGYAALYESESEPLEYYGYKIVEKIRRGAFDKVLKQNDDVRCLFNHDRNYVLGRVSNNTLILRADEKGLYFECEYNPEIAWQADLAKSIKRGDINQCSFAFTLGDEDTIEISDNEKKIYTREIIGFKKLYDVSVVTEPAYSQTEAYLRNAENFLDKLKKEKFQSELDLLETEI